MSNGEVQRQTDNEIVSQGEGAASDQPSVRCNGELGGDLSGSNPISRQFNIPEHLDYWTRNERLYRTLLAFGFYVEPIFVDDSRKAIDHLRVSVGLPIQDMTRDSYLP